MPRIFTPSILAIAVAFSFACAAHAQNIIADGAKWEKVFSAGKGFAEGVVAAKDGTIYMVDIPPPGKLFRYDPKSGQTTTLMEESGMANGLHIDRNGDLLMGQGLPGVQRLAKRNLTTGASPFWPSAKRASG